MSRVLEIRPIEGADRIRLVVVDAGAEPLEIVCGADNFEVGDRVPLAPVGTILPKADEPIARRKLRGVTSNGMLCSGRELGLSDDADGLMILGADAPGEPGTPLLEAIGLERDVVFDITVEGNRPDAWCIAGIARDLANRLHLPFEVPEPPTPEPSGHPVERAATAAVESTDLCPRLTVTVLDRVAVGAFAPVGGPAGCSSPACGRSTTSSTRPTTSCSSWVSPPTPTTFRSSPAVASACGARVRGEVVETLDGVRRTVGVRGRGLGDTGDDCLICDGEDTPVGIAGVMGGASSEIADSTTEVLLEAAYFAPMAIARTSKRLGLRTEASARFERGCDPWGIEPSVARFCQVLGESVPGLRVADGMLDVRGDVPMPFTVSVPVARVRRQIGVALEASEIADLIEPIGFSVLDGGRGDVRSGDERITVTVPTNRPDVRPEPHGVDDVIEEVARTFGYSNIPRHMPTWPQPGALTSRQRSRRVVKDVLCGLGVSEGWTDTFVSAADHEDVGLSGPAVRVSNPLDGEKPFLRRTMLPGLLRALAYNAGRRQPEVGLFEVGVVFSHPDEGFGACVRARRSRGKLDRPAPR